MASSSRDDVLPGVRKELDVLLELEGATRMGSSFPDSSSSDKNIRFFIDIIMRI